MSKQNRYPTGIVLNVGAVIGFEQPYVPQALAERGVSIDIMPGTSG